jgi:hypothetical protein
MKSLVLHTIKRKAGDVSWPLLVFLVLVLNVKLPVKIIAVLFFVAMQWKSISVKDFLKQRYLLFYFSMIGIGIINFLLRYKNYNATYFITLIVGICFWLMSAVIAYLLYTTVQKENPVKIHNTLAAFFILHVTVIFLNLIQIIIETGTLNPYTYKGLNQKYFISTGDFITGISFDAPVTTAFTCVFGLLYFLYRKQFILSIACMAALLIMASNFANLILIGVFVFAFAFYSTKIQKSFILVYIGMLIIFMVKISPQNNEHVGRIFYLLIDKPYDLPPVKTLSLAELKKEPDSLLNFEQRRKKYAQNFIDSMSAIRLANNYKAPANKLAKKIIDSNNDKPDPVFYQFHESVVTEEKINRYAHFINQVYSPQQQDSLKKKYNWKSPGKWIAAKQLINLFKDHPSKILTGDGIANFSSRLAFKATLLNTAGKYPAPLKYINPDFLYNHLYLYLYYHSQGQSKHEAKNTPDAVYYQVAGEYGIAGLLCLLFLYFGYFLRRIPKKSFGLPLLLVLAGALFAEYWFEQFSIIVLFELLLFLDIKELRREEQQP